MKTQGANTQTGTLTPCGQLRWVSVLLTEVDACVGSWLVRGGAKGHVSLGDQQAWLQIKSGGGSVFEALPFPDQMLHVLV